jgi:hypothetical protein
LISLIAPADGVYTIAINDTAFDGGDDYRYALHIGTFVRPSAVFPAGGQIGVENRIRLFGEPSGELTQIVKPEANSSLDMELFATDGKTTAPTAYPFAYRLFRTFSKPNPTIPQRTWLRILPSGPCL